MTIALTNDYSVAEQIELELGPRVFRCLAAENAPEGYRYIQGISDLFFLTDTSDDWSDMWWMIYDDKAYGFSLERGLQALYYRLTDQYGMDEEAAFMWIATWGNLTIERNEEVTDEYESGTQGPTA